MSPDPATSRDRVQATFPLGADALRSKGEAVLFLVVISDCAVSMLPLERASAPVLATLAQRPARLFSESTTSALTHSRSSLASGLPSELSPKSHAAVEARESHDAFKRQRALCACRLAGRLIWRICVSRSFSALEPS